MDKTIVRTLVKKLRQEPPTVVDSADGKGTMLVLLLTQKEAYCLYQHLLKQLTNESTIQK